MEALAVASSAAGLISLGLTVCNGLVTYYSSWKNAAGDVQKMLEPAESLAKTLAVLKYTISNPSLNRDVVQKVEESIFRCENGITALQKKLAKIRLKSQGGTWKDKTWAHLQRSMYPFKESTLVKLKEICLELREHLSLAMDVLQIDTSVASLEKLAVLEDSVHNTSRDVKSIMSNAMETAAKVDALASIQQDERLQKIYDWLSPIAGDFEQKQFDIFNTEWRQDRMGQLVVGKRQFQKWLREIGSIILCTGIPGSGKSVLASFVIDSLQRASATRDVGVAYIYFSYKESKQQTPANVLASLLQQLLLQKCAVKDNLLSLYDRHGNKTRPSLSEYTQLLQTTIHSFSKVYVIIDALDECPETNSMRECFLAQFQEVQRYICTFVTSRHIASIERHFSDAIRLDVEPDDEDIHNYLGQRLLRWQSLKVHLKRDASLYDLIIQSLTAKAKKMFLLARLYVEALMRLPTIRKIKAALVTLPERLESMYDDVVERIQMQDSENSTLALKVLSWIFFAVRPLRIQELQYALAVEPGDPSLDEDGLPHKDLVLSVCAGIVTIQEGDVIAFIHYTAQEYFERQAPTLLRDAQCEIAQICLTYLMFEDFAGGPSSNNEAFEKRLLENPFLGYAASYWGHHLRGPPETPIQDLALEFIGDESRVSASVQVERVSKSGRGRNYMFNNYSQNFPKQVPRLVLAAQFGLNEIVSVLLRDGIDIESSDSHGFRALHRAVKEGHENLVKALLENGAEIDAQIYGRGPTPLHLAAGEGHYELVLLLLTKNANVNARDSLGWTPLHDASWSGHVSVVELLVNRGAVIDAKSIYSYTALYLAAANGHVGVVQLLIKWGTVIDVKADDRVTALYTAADHGYVGAVQLLEEQKADVNIRSLCFAETALSTAAENGQKATVKLLLENGADWTLKDDLGRGPAHLAMEAGYPDVGVLLEHWAAEKGKEKKVQKEGRKKGQKVEGKITEEVLEGPEEREKEQV